MFEALEDADEESQIIFENQNNSNPQPEEKEVELKEKAKITKKEPEEKKLFYSRRREVLKLKISTTAKPATEKMIYLIKNNSHIFCPQLK